MGQKRILIVDDDLSIISILRIILEKENHLVIAAETGEDAFKRMEENDLDAVILDLQLPDITGLKVLQYIRNNPMLQSIPVLMLTGNSEEIDTVLALEMGADDYIHKPFRKRELIARLNVAYRRSEKDRQLKRQTIIFGDVEIDILKHKVVKGMNAIAMSPKEFQLLVLLTNNPGRIYSRDELLDRIWGYDYAVETRTVDVHIRKLRKKIEEDSNHPVWIETVRGLGYRFRN